MPREFSRGQRIADLIQRELAILIQRELKDPRVGILTINEVKVSRDISFADVYFTLLSDNNDNNKESAEEALNHASGFLRSQLARVLNTRTTPRLRFHFDDSVANGRKLSDAIEAALAEDAQRKRQT